MKILIVIPAYNEEKSIERVVDNLIENYSQYDYIVVNDGSKDGTARVCRDRGVPVYRSANQSGADRGIPDRCEICRCKRI